MIDYYAFKTYVIASQEPDQYSKWIDKSQWSLLESYMHKLREDESQVQGLEAFLQSSESTTSEDGEDEKSDKRQGKSFLGISFKTFNTDGSDSTEITEITHDTEFELRWDTLGTWREFWALQRDTLWLEVLHDDGETRVISTLESSGPPLGIFCRIGDYASLEKVIPTIHSSAFGGPHLNPPLCSLLMNDRLRWYEKEDLAESLISNGADLEELNAEDTCSIIHKAVVDGHEGVTRALLTHGADVNATSLYGDTPLHQCALSKNPDKMMRVLFEKDPDIMLADDYGNTILHYLAANLCLREVPDSTGLNFLKTVLARGLHVDSCNHNGRTPLHIAVIVGNTAMVKNLLAFNASAEVQDVFLRSPKHYAAVSGDAAAVKVLLGAGYIDVEDFAGRYFPTSHSTIVALKRSVHLFGTRPHSLCAMTSDTDLHRSFPSGTRNCPWKLPSGAGVPRQ